MSSTFTPEQIEQFLQEFFTVVGRRQYIGARYVPMFGRKGESSIDWDNSAPYEPLTIVNYQGNSYTSKTYVPAGVDILNQSYWANTGNYNAQIEQYRSEVLLFDSRIDALENYNNNFWVNAVSIGIDNTGTEDNADALNEWFDNNPDKTLYFPNGTYNISKQINPSGSIVMEEKAYFNVTDSIVCAVHVNGNYQGSTNFIFGIPRNTLLLINIKCNKKAEYGIRTDALHWAKCVFTVDNPIVAGVVTQYNNAYGHAENTFDIQVSCDLGIANTATGLISKSSDEIFNNVVCINCHVGVEIIGGDCVFKCIHPWIYDTQNWSGSVGILQSGTSINKIDTYTVDTVETGIKVSGNALNARFSIIIDFLFAMINHTIIDNTLSASFKLWDCTGLSNESYKNSTLQINAYNGNDSFTTTPNLGGNGICPNATVLNYQGEYTAINWKYDINYCPEGSFRFVPSSTNNKHIPVNISASASEYIVIVKNTTMGKYQKIIPSTNENISTFTRGNYLSTSPANVEDGTFLYEYNRVFNYNTFVASPTVHQPWGYYTSTYIQPDEI